MLNLTTYTTLSPSVIWTLSYFSLYFYLLLIFSTILFLIPLLKDYLDINYSKNYSKFSYLTGFDLYWLNLTPLFLILLLNWSWTGPLVTAWFGHLVFSTFQLKVSYLFLFFSLLLITSYLSIFYYSSAEIYDYTIVLFNFLTWLNLLFYSNNVFTFIFFIEILSTLIVLILITSTFSSLYFYNNLSLTLNNYFTLSTPFAFLQTLLFLFWVSLVSSLNLFISLILLYLKFLTFNWFLLEHLFSYLILNQSLKSLLFISVIWFNFMFCIFLKCGLAPFYFWKPTFFKGMPLHLLMFYILIFYFFLLLFITYSFLIFLSELFYFNTLLNLFILMTGLTFLFFIVLESFYVKAFLAVSSIINTFFIFLAMSSLNTFELFLFY